MEQTIFKQNYNQLNGVYECVNHNPKYLKKYSYIYKKMSKVLFNEIPKFTSGDGEYRKEYFDFLNIKEEDVKDKVVLDAGCGSGWMIKKILKYKPKLIAGIDLSRSVYYIKKMEGNYILVHGDLMDLPFNENTFDTIYSWGVLQHIPDFSTGFNNLKKCLKKGGKLSIFTYGYDQNLLKPMFDFHRKWTTKLPVPLLYHLTKLSIPLCYLYKIPPFKLLQFLLPIRLPRKPKYYITPKQWNEVWICTLDDYLNTYWNTYNYEEVYNLFKKDFKDIEIKEPPISINGVKK